MPVELAHSNAVHALYSNHHGWLLNWLRRKLGCAHSAADLAHDTFMRVIVSQRTFALEDEPRALLSCIARGLVIDHWRRQEIERAYLETLAGIPERQAPSPEEQALILEALCCIEAVLRGMPAKTREIFLLSQLDGCTYRQISERTGVSVITVKRHMRRAFIACLSVA